MHLILHLGNKLGYVTATAGYFYACMRRFWGNCKIDPSGIYFLSFIFSVVSLRQYRPLWIGLSFIGVCITCKSFFVFIPFYRNGLLSFCVPFGAYHPAPCKFPWFGLLKVSPRMFTVIFMSPVLKATILFCCAYFIVFYQYNRYSII